MKPVLIFGNGQVADTLRDYLARVGQRVAGYIVDEEYLTGGLDHLRPCDGAKNAPGYYNPAEHLFMVGMSYQKVNKPRAEVFARMLAMGYGAATLIVDPGRIAAGVSIGRGSFIQDGNVIQTGCEIGENCILWATNHLGHHTKIGNHVFIASHAVISGACSIGDRCFIGVNATIRDGVTIGEGCVIGAGASIMSDCEPNGLYPGPRTERAKLPAEKLRRI
jgi:sugar O-acyltransferase (sialic acid O-acetyltransferase NeuD family)